MSPARYVASWFVPCRSLVLTVMAGLLCASIVAAAERRSAPKGKSLDDHEFFEKRIRPILVEHCYQCHNSHKNREGNLALDCREGCLAGGDTGPAIVPGKAEESPLVWAIRHEHDLKMPQGGPKLSERVVADFVTWINRGAPDPRDKPPSAEELAQATSWEVISAARRQWWSFQPVAHPPLPSVQNSGWSPHPVDRFILARLEAESLEPSGRADPLLLVRRVTLLLTGLPPTPDEVRDFVNDKSPQAYEALIDRLLASPRFGERWARHWMDWVRYAETHGSEGDPPIPYAWRYRDYLIRALNADVPYDQLVREHLAGDLLAEPRIDAATRTNESALGTGHYRMVLHGYSPTDALDEEVRFTDNQIDVISKAFLGLTVSCARCHNHKFDAISQRDFYALYGIMASCRPALITIDTPEKLQMNRAELAECKARLKPALAADWLAGLDQVTDRLRLLPEPTSKKSRDERRLAAAKKKPVDALAPIQRAVDESAEVGEAGPLSAWLELRDRPAAELPEAWKQLVAHHRRRVEQQAKFEAAQLTRRWNFTTGGYDGWFPYGIGLASPPAKAGDFYVLAEGRDAIGGVYPAGAYSHRLSSKHNGVLSSPRFQIDSDEIRVRVAGDGGARIRFVIDNYPRAAGPIYFAATPNRNDLGWFTWNMKYWKGEWAHLEIATSGDLPVEAEIDHDRSWFGLAEVVCRNLDDPMPVELGAPVAALAPEPIASLEDLAERYRQALRAAIEAWRDDRASDAQAALLGACVRAGVLPNTVDALSQAKTLVAEYRRLEGQVPVPTRAPGVLETVAYDQPLYIRGNHRQPSEIVPRRFLEAFDGHPYKTAQSGRLELACEMTSPANPLVSRVIVNRLWHHLFGRGIVPTVDNFGRLGEEPTHPELLDYLATRFVDEGWSLKKMIRFLLMTETFRTDHAASPTIHQRDPDNELWSHFLVRRLEAEAVRDSILYVSGRLDPTMYGPSVFGRTPRRSLYLAVRRNSLDPFLHAFDFPEPHAPQGRRDITNVPAQSLALLNDPLVIEQARRWAESILKRDSSADPQNRLRDLFLVALGRQPSPEELDEASRYLADLDRQYAAGEPREKVRALLVWQAMAQSMMNLKEFIYLD
jgi:uncharacterized protein DUF1553/uncharacterized protein DUF1549/cytochrome c